MSDLQVVISAKLEEKAFREAIRLKKEWKRKVKERPPLRKLKEFAGRCEKTSDSWWEGKENSGVFHRISQWISTVFRGIFQLFFSEISGLKRSPQGGKPPWPPSSPSDSHSLMKKILCVWAFVILWLFQEKVSDVDLCQCMHLTILLLTRLQNHKLPSRAVFQVVQFGK